MTMSNGSDETQVGGTPPSTPDEPSDNRKLWLIALSVLLFGILIGVGVAVAGGGGDDKKQAGDDTSTSTSSSTSTSASTSTTAATAPTQTNGNTSPTAPSDDPKINSLTASSGSPATCTKDNPMGFDSPTDPYNLTISWSTTNATQTVLSIDGSGAYGTYGPSASQALTLGCSGSQSHTYMITASGPNGPNATRTISFTLNEGP